MNNYYNAQLPDLPKSSPAHEKRELLLPVNSIDNRCSHELHAAFFQIF